MKSSISLGKLPDAYVIDYRSDSFYLFYQSQIAIDLRLVVGKTAQHDPAFLDLNPYIKIGNVDAGHQRDPDSARKH